LKNPDYNNLVGKPLVATRLDERTYKTLIAISRESGSQLSDIIRRAIKEWLTRYRGGKVIEPLKKR
jgi:hypothetical protein